MRSRGPPGAELGDHPVAQGVAVPGDDPGALAGVGRRELLADQRVEQGRLAGLDLAGDRHPQRLVEPPLGDPDLVLLVGPAGDLQRLGRDAPDVRGQIARAGGHVHACGYGRSTQLPVFWFTEWLALATRMHIWVAPAGLSLTL